MSSSARNNRVRTFAKVALAAIAALILWTYFTRSSVRPPRTPVPHSAASQTTLIPSDFKQEHKSLAVATLSKYSKIRRSALLDDVLEAYVTFQSSLKEHEVKVPVIESVVTHIPKNILQTARDGSESPFSGTWTRNNAYTRYLTNDDENLDFVRKHMGDRIAEMFSSLPVPILRVDLFRYIIAYVMGGIYADIDTSCLKELDNWLPTDDSPKDLSYDKGLPQSVGKFNSRIGLIVGIEADGSMESNYYESYERKIQLCQWAFAVKQGHPALRLLIERILDKTAYFSQYHYRLDVMDWTGPAIFTDVILEYIRSVAAREGDPNWNIERLFGMRDSLLVGDVLILPITGFSPGVGHMGSKGTDDPLAFVQHHFDGSWTTQEDLYG